MTELRVTSLSSFVKCQYQYKYGPKEFDPVSTYHGDLLNIGLTSQGDISPFWKYYGEIISADIKTLEKGEYNTVLAQLMMQSLKQSFANVYHETKIYWNHSDDIRIVGTPDIAFVPEGTKEERDWLLTFYGKELYEEYMLDDLSDIVFIADGKHSTHSYYFPGNQHENEKYDFNMQTWFYPLFYMYIFKKNRGVFTYLVADKAKGGFKYGSVYRTKKQCQEMMDKVVAAWQEADLWDNYIPQRNQGCWFCPLKKTCPAWVKSYTDISESDDDDFM